MTYKDLKWISKDSSSKVAVAQYAGVTSRFFAALVDITIVAFLVLGLKEFLFSEIFIEETTKLISPYFEQLKLQKEVVGIYSKILATASSAGIYIALIPIISFFYFIIFNCSPLQATIGKWLFRIHIINKNGYNIGFFRSFFRTSVATIIFAAGLFIGGILMPFGAVFLGAAYFAIYLIIIFIDLVFALFNKRKLALHDLICDTRVMVGSAGIYAGNQANSTEEDDDLAEVLEKKPKKEKSNKIEAKKNW